MCAMIDIDQRLYVVRDTDNDAYSYEIVEEMFRDGSIEALVREEERWWNNAGVILTTRAMHIRCSTSWHRTRVREEFACRKAEWLRREAACTDTA